jgi:exodeoxyribonuclease VII large subunit
MALDFRGAEPATTRGPLTVSALNRAVAGLLERSFPLVRVRGEVANLTRAASGHWYFVLKDDQAQVRCVMFRGRNQLLNWVPRDGDEVEVSAAVSLYEARGEFQLGIESMQRAGQGRLFEEFLRLKARLAAEGVFDADAKRPLPGVPRCIGVVTSLQAAALRDVLTCLARRAPYASVVVYPVPVQGAGAGERIARATGSSLNAQRSSRDPPPRTSSTTSTSARSETVASIAAIRSPAPAPWTGTG